jgi:succinate dehydrogenase / fumarate reductase flavoprotein subunit
VKSFCYQDSPRRAHSIAAQGGINAAKNYKEDGDSVYRLFYDTVKGGDYRARETNVYRLAEVSANDHRPVRRPGRAVRPRVRRPARQPLLRWRPGVRTFYARGQTGQQLLIGAYQALERQVAAGTVEQFTRHEMLELIVVEGRARGIIARDLVTGEIETHLADAVVLASGGYGNVFFLSTNAMGSNVTASWRAHRKGAYMANPCYTQIHPTCIPVSGDHQSKLTLMSESLRNDGRIWVPKRREDCDKDPRRSPRRTATTTWSGSTRASATSCPATSPRGRPRTSATRAAVSARWSATSAAASTSTSPTPSATGQGAVEAKYGNLFDMYARITGENPYEVPMRIYPAVHYTMGGLWVDYDLQSTIPGLFVTGEANFSDHGANRLGASALMQGLADGYFVLPNTIRDYLAKGPFEPLSTDAPAVVEAAPRSRSASATPAPDQRRAQRRLLPQGTRPHHVGVLRHGALRGGACSRPSTSSAVCARSSGATCGPRAADTLNQSLEKAGRVADFLELGELMCIDALHRRESCGGHFRAESQTEDGEALRHDDEFLYVAAWEFAGGDGDGEMGAPVLHKEDLVYEASN